MSVATGAPGETVASPIVRATRAPSLASAASTARSPWRLARSSPETQTSLERAPAASQKAALDQSPSTSTVPGER